MGTRPASARGTQRGHTGTFVGRRRRVRPNLGRKDRPGAVASARTRSSRMITALPCAKPLSRRVAHAISWPEKFERIPTHARKCAFRSHFFRRSVLFLEPSWRSSALGRQPSVLKRREKQSGMSISSHPAFLEGHRRPFIFDETPPLKSFVLVTVLTDRVTFPAYRLFCSFEKDIAKPACSASCVVSSCWRVFMGCGRVHSLPPS